MDLDCDICLINLAGKMATHGALPQALNLLDCIRGPGVRVGARKSSPLGSIFSGSLSSGAVPCALSVSPSAVGRYRSLSLPYFRFHLTYLFVTHIVESAHFIFTTFLRLTESSLCLCLFD
jgi:hypothetical protein